MLLLSLITTLSIPLLAIAAPTSVPLTLINKCPVAVQPAFTGTDAPTGAASIAAGQTAVIQISPSFIGQIFDQDSPAGSIRSLISMPVSRSSKRENNWQDGMLTALHPLADRVLHSSELQNCIHTAEIPNSTRSNLIHPQLATISNYTRTMGIVPSLSAVGHVGYLLSLVDADNPSCQRWYTTLV
jgi:hypothetical protein